MCARQRLVSYPDYTGEIDPPASFSDFRFASFPDVVFDTFLDYQGNAVNEAAAAQFSEAD